MPEMGIDRHQLEREVARAREEERRREEEARQVEIAEACQLMENKNPAEPRCGATRATPAKARQGMPTKLVVLIAAMGALLLLPLSAGAARAEKRVALVIGNGAYQSVARLANPVKDAAAIADMFRKAGFDWVRLREDVGNLEFKRALREFMDAAQDADVAVVYYAGHGIQVRDMNYMIPVDAKLATEVDAEDEAVSLDRIVMALEPAKRLRLVILDACRDNPFARTMKRRVAVRAISGGLAKMEPTLGDTLIAYAAKAGSTAEDGDGENSPFAAALVKYLDGAGPRHPPGLRPGARRGAQAHRKQAGTVRLRLARRRIDFARSGAAGARKPGPRRAGREGARGARSRAAARRRGKSAQGGRSRAQARRARSGTAPRGGGKTPQSRGSRAQARRARGRAAAGSGSQAPEGRGSPARGHRT